MHSVIGACLPVQRRQLSFAELSEDEASSYAYEELQEKDKWWLSHMQTTDCAVLLSCETLPRNQVSCPVLLQYQAQDQATTIATTITTSAIAQVSRVADFLFIFLTLIYSIVFSFFFQALRY